MHGRQYYFQSVLMFLNMIFSYSLLPRYPRAFQSIENECAYSFSCTRGIRVA